LDVETGPTTCVVDCTSSTNTPAERKLGMDQFSGNEERLDRQIYRDPPLFSGRVDKSEISKYRTIKKNPTVVEVAESMEV
jgi:hypothetical protein